MENTIKNEWSYPSIFNWIRDDLKRRFQLNDVIHHQPVERVMKITSIAVTLTGHHFSIVIIQPWGEKYCEIWVTKVGEIPDHSRLKLSNANIEMVGGEQFVAMLENTMDAQIKKSLKIDQYGTV